MSRITQEYKIKCWNDCQWGGCPSHNVKIEANNTSNALLYTKDGDAKFGMDFDEELEAFIKEVYTWRHWVEIDRIFKELETPQKDTK